MRLAAKTDIDAPVSDVFWALSDLDSLEKQALRHGAEVQRLDRLRDYQVGSAWDVRFFFRGRQRRVSSTISTFDPPKCLGIEGQSTGYEFVLVARLVPMSLSQTRLAVDLNILPRNFGSRLLLNTLKLGKSRLEARLALRLEEFAALLRQRVRARGRP